MRNKVEAHSSHCSRFFGLGLCNDYSSRKFSCTSTARFEISIWFGHFRKFQTTQSQCCRWTCRCISGYVYLRPIIGTARRKCLQKRTQLRTNRAFQVRLSDEYGMGPQHALSARWSMPSGTILSRVKTNHMGPDLNRPNKDSGGRIPKYHALTSTLFRRAQSGSPPCIFVYPFLAHLWNSQSRCSSTLGLKHRYDSQLTKLLSS